MLMINSLPNLEKVSFDCVDLGHFSRGVKSANGCWFRQRLQPLAVPTSQQSQGARRSRLLHQLTTCFGSYAVETLKMRPDMDDEDFALVGRLLGRLDKLRVGSILDEDFMSGLSIDLKALASSEPAPAAEEGLLPPPEGLISAAEVAEAALRRMQCGDLGDAEEGELDDGEAYALLLQGSYLEGLRDSPGALLPAIRSLREKAAAAAAANGGGGGVPGPLADYQELPAAARSSSLLLYCMWDQPGAVAAVMAAVEGVAAGRGPGFLRVAPVSVYAVEAFLKAVRQEIKVLWGDEANRRRVGDMQWLLHLLGLWCQLNEFPDEQSLDA